ncbi:MAG: hypothetical protein WKG06_24315 [Segetibacter sp.]
MKPLVIILIGLIASSLTFVYLIIPDTIRVSEIVKIHSNEKAASRSLINENEWKNGGLHTLGIKVIRIYTDTTTTTIKSEINMLKDWKWKS